jgi:integrase
MLIGALPPMRPARVDIITIMPASFRDEFESYLERKRRGRPTAISGRSRGVQPKTTRLIRDAVGRWLRLLHERGILAPTTRAGLADVLVENEIEPVRDRALEEHNLQPRTVKLMLTLLGTLAADVAAPNAITFRAHVKHALDVEAFDTAKGMTARNRRWCRRLLQQPKIKRAYAALPSTLRDLAQAQLDRWDQLTWHQRTEALHAGAASCMALILTRVSPMRVSNLLQLVVDTDDDEERHIFPPVRPGQAGQIFLAARFVKNKQAIDADIPRGGAVDAWAHVAWYLDVIRPRLLRHHRLGHQGRSPFLFPGVGQKPLSYSTALDWFQIACAKGGLPMDPHQARHAWASLILNEDWSALRRVAEMLGDTQRTVLENYAWLDSARLVRDGQAMMSGILNSAHAAGRTR